MALDVTINLTTEQISGTASSGIPLIFSGVCGETDIPYTKCRSLSDVKNAGFAADTPAYKAAELLFKQKNSPKTIAVAGVTQSPAFSDELFDEDWRQLIVVNHGNVKPWVIAKAVEEHEDKLFFTSISIKDADTLDDEAFQTAWNEVIGELKTFTRTVAMYYDDTIATPEAALVGATAGYSAGSFTYKNIILEGIPALKLSDKRVEIINGSDETGHGLTAVKKAGDIVTTEGKTAKGEYVDVIDSKDWIIENIGYNLQKLFNSQPKIPYTTPGITQLENATLSVLKTAFNNGMIAPIEGNENTGNYSTSFKTKAEIREQNAADITDRHYPGGNFTFELAGAVHDAEINGTITW
ncbi:MAG: DUF3383 family protein [bacterium]|nr:DUF3383 family protein [bacterium]